MIYLCAIAVLLLVAERFFHPTRSLELRALSRALDLGRGWDDVAEQILVKFSERYAPAVIAILETATPGSKRETVVLNVVEMLIDEAGVVEALARFAEDHPNQDTSQLAREILGGPVESVPLHLPQIDADSSVELILGAKAPAVKGDENDAASR